MSVKNGPEQLNNIDKQMIIINHRKVKNVITSTKWQSDNVLVC